MEGIFLEEREIFIFNLKIQKENLEKVNITFHLFHKFEVKSIHNMLLYINFKIKTKKGK